MTTLLTITYILIALLLIASMTAAIWHYTTNRHHQRWIDSLRTHDLIRVTVDNLVIDAVYMYQINATWHEVEGLDGIRYRVRAEEIRPW